MRAAEVAEINSQQIQAIIQHGHLDIFLAKTHKMHRYVFTDYARNKALEVERIHVFAHHQRLAGTVPIGLFLLTRGFYLPLNILGLILNLILFELVTLPIFYSSLLYNKLLPLLVIGILEALLPIIVMYQTVRLFCSCLNAVPK